jgi:hypothetical protein
MTRSSLKSWRERLYGARGKSAAARALGLSNNGYNRYEAGKHRIPKHVELACGALAFGLAPMSAIPPDDVILINQNITEIDEAIQASLIKEI